VPMSTLDAPVLRLYQRQPTNFGSIGNYPRVILTRRGWKGDLGALRDLGAHTPRLIPVSIDKKWPGPRTENPGQVVWWCCNA